MKSKEVSPTLRPYIKDRLQLQNSDSKQALSSAIDAFNNRIKEMLIADKKIDKLKPLKSENKELLKILKHE